MVDVSRLRTSVKPPLAVRETDGVDMHPVDTVVFPSDVQRIIPVPQGQVLIITAYGLTVGDTVTVSKVLCSAGVDERSFGSCCEVVPAVPSTILSRVQMPCWTLRHDTPVLTIRLVGMYVVEVGSEAVQDIVITTQAIKMQDTSSGLVCTPTVLEEETWSDD